MYMSESGAMTARTRSAGSELEAQENARTRLVRIKNWEELASQAKYRPADLADRCLISLRQLERYFKRYRSKTPRCWLREMQCDSARRLIENGYSTKAAAKEVHFCNEAEMCHQFQKFYKRPPQSFAPIPGKSRLNVARAQ